MLFYLIKTENPISFYISLFADYYCSFFAASNEYNDSMHEAMNQTVIAAKSSSIFVVTFAIYKFFATCENLNLYITYCDILKIKEFLSLSSKYYRH